MKILVTGCKGQLGNEMQLLEEKNPQHLYFNTDVEDLDITDEVAIERYVDEHEIDGIVNCAAYTAVDKAEENPSICRMLNATAPGFLAAAVERRGGWMIQISTDYVFDGTGHQPYVETDPTCPDSVYGTTKLEGEQTVMATCHRTMIIRTAWLYSSFGNNFVKTMIRLSKERKELGVVFDQIGTPTYAADLAWAVFTVIEAPVWHPGIYHFTNEGVCSWYDFTIAILALANSTECQVRPILSEEYQYKTPRPHYSVLDKSKFKKTYNVQIPYWIDGLHRCMEMLKK